MGRLLHNSNVGKDIRVCLYQAKSKFGFPLGRECPKPITGQGQNFYFPSLGSRNGNFFPQCWGEPSYSPKTQDASSAKAGTSMCSLNCSVSNSDCSDTPTPSFHAPQCLWALSTDFGCQSEYASPKVLCCSCYDLSGFWPVEPYGRAGNGEPCVSCDIPDPHSIFQEGREGGKWVEGLWKWSKCMIRLCWTQIRLIFHDLTGAICDQSHRV